ncbi:hypothetical protein PTQ40_33110, partial [Klebsiella michiganensis]|nr:hypothetical protein [Klebsiella michiganensis]
EWVHVQLHQQKGMISLSPPTICNSAKKRKVFLTDASVQKVVYLAIKDASKKWSIPIQNWRLAMNRFIIEFGDRLSDHL